MNNKILELADGVDIQTISEHYYYYIKHEVILEDGSRAELVMSLRKKREDE